MSDEERSSDGPGDPDDVLTDGLTALIIQGISFTTETNPAGHIEYLIGGARLNADDIRRLQQQGAVTPHGIQSHLISRKVA
jgi:hypothetical protein